MFGDILDVNAIVLQTTIGLHLGVLLPVPLGEAPVLAHVDLLTSGELELGSSQGLNNLILKITIKILEKISSSILILQIFCLKCKKHF